MIRTLVALVALVSAGAMFQVPPAAAQSAASTAARPAGPAATAININTADVAGLSALPGIGAKTADLIVAYRKENGPFKKVEELMNVRGIGEKSFLKLRELITVGPAKGEQAGAR